MHSCFFSLFYIPFFFIILACLASQHAVKDGMLQSFVSHGPLLAMLHPHHVALGRHGFTDRAPTTASREIQPVKMDVNTQKQSQQEFYHTPA